MNIETRFYHPLGVAADHRTQSLYVADSYNHLIRRVVMTDIVEEVVEEPDTWDEVTQKVIMHNLVLITIIVGGLAVLCVGTFFACRYCFICPVYRRRLHQKFVARMTIGQRV